MQKHLLPIVLGALMVVMATGGCADGPASSTHTFVVMGCNRMGREAVRATEDGADPSTANVPQLRQTFADVAALDPQPTRFFFAGDLVFNLADDDGATLTTELDAWQKLYRTMPLPSDVELLPMPGNHELLAWMAEFDREVPDVGANHAWDAWIARNGYDARCGNGPTADGANPDHLVLDERRRTFSFDEGAIHYVIVNTDTDSTVIDHMTHRPVDGWIPLHWVERDIAAAQADPAIEHIFVIGHRPLRMPTFDAHEPGVIDTTEHPLATGLIDLLDANDKVRAYLCAHSHCWQVQRLGRRGVHQVIAGNGGSPLVPDWHPQGGTFFGFGVVHVEGNGRITLACHGRPAPDPASAVQAPEPATVRNVVVLHEPGD